MILSLFMTVIEMACLYTLLVVSVWMTSRLLKFEDISIEATFGFAGAITARLLQIGCWPVLTPFMGMLAGAALGIVTGLLHSVLQLSSVLSGVIMVTAFFSINLLIASANVPLMHVKTVFDLIPSWSFVSSKCMVLAIIAVAIIAFVRWLLRTEVGFVLRAVGSNPLLIAHLGKSPAFYNGVCLCIAHACVGLAGSLFVQYTGFFSLWSSVGIVVIAFASLMLAMTIRASCGYHLIIGPLLYQSIIAVSLYAHIAPEWNKLVAAVLLTLLLLFQKRNLLCYA